MALLQYNENSANNAGVGQGVTESGAYTGIIYAKSITAGTGSKGIEFTLKGNQDCNYLTCYYQKSDGSEIRGGLNVINAIMGLLGITEINERPAMKNGQQVMDDYGKPVIIIPELNNKALGLVLQKTMYTKAGGGDGYKFDIVMPFNERTRQTMQEMNSRQQAKRIDEILVTLRDKDERDHSAHNQSINNATTNNPQTKFNNTAGVDSATVLGYEEDDIPW